MWQPLSISKGFVTGKSTEGPVNEQSQITCFDFIWGVTLTNTKLLSEPSEKLPSPMAANEREGKTAAIKSLV